MIGTPKRRIRFSYIDWTDGALIRVLETPDQAAARVFADAWRPADELVEYFATDETLHDLRSNLIEIDDA